MTASAAVNPWLSRLCGWLEGAERLFWVLCSHFLLKQLRHVWGIHSNAEAGKFILSVNPTHTSEERSVSFLS